MKATKNFKEVQAVIEKIKADRGGNVTGYEVCYLLLGAQEMACTLFKDDFAAVALLFSPAINEALASITISLKR